MNAHAALTLKQAADGAARMGAAVAVRGLVKRFADAPPVLDGIDLDVERGERVAIIGANGTGKSTLVRSLVRLVEPTAGTICLLGQPVTGVDRRALSRLRARTGFVFQKHNLVPRLSALSNVVHGVQSRARGPRTWHQALAPRAVRAEAMVCLERVGLAGRAAARVDTLSGGQSQRVAIARMLMQRPELVIADEPDASLDPQAGEEVMALLASLTREAGATLIVVSHRMEHALAWCERIVGLRQGRVVLDRPASGLAEADLRAFFHHG
jgi:phosphonate transport system ATP-binding protein